MSERELELLDAAEKFANDHWHWIAGIAVESGLRFLDAVQAYQLECAERDRLLAESEAAWNSKNGAKL